VAFDTVLHLISWAAPRYRLPSDAVMMVFAGLAVADLAGRVGWRRSGGAGERRGRGDREMGRQGEGEEEGQGDAVTVDRGYTAAFTFLSPRTICSISRITIGKLGWVKLIAWIAIRWGTDQAQRQ
jgi:hypothetical protein